MVESFWVLGVGRVVVFFFFFFWDTMDVLVWFVDVVVVFLVDF